MKWEVVIGLETHAQLRTVSKIFSGASTAFGAEAEINLVSRGLYFDTLDDTTKLDPTNTTVSLNTYDNRAGLIGGQQYLQTTTDNYGNTLLGSTAITDIMFYDRKITDSVDSTKISMGVDPNWYNGVTLTTKDATTNPAGSVNTNLSSTYNGSLLSVRGTYTTNPATIYITIKTMGCIQSVNYSYEIIPKASLRHQYLYDRFQSSEQSMFYLVIYQRQINTSLLGYQS